LRHAISHANDGDAVTLSAAKDHADSGDETTLRRAISHANDGDASTLQSANAYTDVKYAQAVAVPLAAVDRLRTDMDVRFRMQDRRIDQMGAMTAAMVHMAASGAAGQTQNRIAVGVGFQGGQAATSFGYQRVINARATMSVGVAFSASERSAGAGFSLGW
uniref:YadA C-terminal domain-containing protein n=1 Tax=Lysobacter antibioticus TaxID=84531 RepID=UPI00190F2FFB